MLKFLFYVLLIFDHCYANLLIYNWSTVTFSIPNIPKELIGDPSLSI
jgi:hypothetical protein